jgi:hypothetical protein
MTHRDRYECDLSGELHRARDVVGIESRRFSRAPWDVVITEIHISGEEIRERDMDVDHFQSIEWIGHENGEIRRVGLKSGGRHDTNSVVVEHYQNVFDLLEEEIIW